jgi:pantoate--beta-alanine ligase
VVLVPPTGALHHGHRELLRAAHTVVRTAPGSSVVVSVFVNPLQFGPGEDLDRYPRTLEADLAMCAAEGVDAVFAPSAAEMYPGGRPCVTVDPGPAGQVLEGEFRPGFFGGVLTVVLKLFSLVRPAVAVFGEKDAQQLALIQRMVTDLDLGLRIEAVPTVRDTDGLAVSSRNRYLSAAERATALALPRALQAGAAAVKAARAAAQAPPDATDSAGPGPRLAAVQAAVPAAVLAAAQRVLDAVPAVIVDYLALVDPVTFGPASDGPAVLAAAARVGTTRLIDNVRIDLGG